MKQSENGEQDHENGLPLLKCADPIRLAVDHFEGSGDDFVFGGMGGDVHC